MKDNKNILTEANLTRNEGLGFLSVKQKKVTKIKKLPLYLLTVFSLTVTSCNFLDVNPEHMLAPETFYNTEQELFSGLVGIYDVLGHNQTYGYHMLGRMGLDADHSYYSRAELIGVAVYDTYPSDPLVTGLWQRFYDGINRANFLLEHIDKPDMSEERRDIIRGEAKFLRAYYYFILVSNFGPVPLKTASNQSPQDVTIPRTPAREVYNFVIQEMEEAEALVQPATAYNGGGRINKSTVRGILARVNLYMAGHPINDALRWAEARKWTRMVMDDSDAGHELNPDFKQVFINYARDEYDIKESIWEVEFWGYPDGTYTEGGRVGNTNGIRAQHTNSEQTERIGFSMGHVVATGELFQQYADRTRGTDRSAPTEEEYESLSRDTRRDWTIAPFWYWSGSAHTSSTKVWWPSTSTSEVYRRYAGKFRREYEVVSPKSTSTTPQNFPLLRYSDVLLMFAEAENEVNGATPEALEAINQVKRRAYAVDQHTPGQTDRYGDPVDEVGLSQEELRSYIRDERSRELAYELLRKGDLVRWGIFYERMQEARVSAEIYASSANAHRYFRNVSPRDERWPIPAREIGLNTALTQNPGW